MWVFVEGTNRPIQGGGMDGRDVPGLGRKESEIRVSVATGVAGPCLLCFLTLNPSQLVCVRSRVQ